MDLFVPANDSVDYTCEVDNVQDSFTNKACVEEDGSELDCDTAEVEVIDIDIEKTPDLQIVTPGSDVTFTIRVENTGDEDLTNVVVTDVLTPDCDRNIGDLAVSVAFKKCQLQGFALVFW